MSGEWDNQFRACGCLLSAGIAALVGAAFLIGWWLRG
jgi:hypothetical protein